MGATVERGGGGNSPLWSEQRAEGEEGRSAKSREETAARPELSRGPMGTTRWRSAVHCAGGGGVGEGAAPPGRRGARHRPPPPPPSY